MGRKTLFQWFESLEQPQCHQIQERQEKWLQWQPFLWRLISFRVIGERNRESFTSTSIDFDRSLVSERFFKYFKIQSALLITMWVLVLLGGFGYLSISPAVPIIIYLFFILTTRSEAQNSFHRSNDLAQQIQALVPLLRHIELRFKDAAFSDHFKSLHRSQFSQKSKKLQFLISLLSVQAHGMAHIAVNLIIPWEYLITVFVEKWRVSVAKELPLAWRNWESSRL